MTDDNLLKPSQMILVHSERIALNESVLDLAKIINISDVLSSSEQCGRHTLIFRAHPLLVFPENVPYIHLQNVEKEESRLARCSPPRYGLIINVGLGNEEN